MCLEEMLTCSIPEGALFYGMPRRRHEVVLDDVLRNETERLSCRVHELLASGKTPPAVYEKKCKNCSLLELCMPKTTGGGKSAVGYLKTLILDRGGEMKKEECK
jgi:CRISPR-associated exonuclease Cas4